MIATRITAEPTVVESILPAAAETADQVMARFGRFGGRYAPETLMTPLIELEAAWTRLRAEPGAQASVLLKSDWVKSFFQVEPSVGHRIDEIRRTRNNTKAATVTR